MNTDYNKLSNAELQVILKSLENEYESTKNKIRGELSLLEALDKKYVEINEIRTKRTRGKI